MDGVIRVNVINFITIGLIALVFAFVARLVLTKFWPQAAGMVFGGGAAQQPAQS